MQITKKIVVSSLAAVLSLSTCVGTSFSIFGNDTAIVASAAVPSSIKISEMTMFDLQTPTMMYNMNYNATIFTNSGSYIGMKFAVSKAGNTSLSMTATTNKLALLIADANGTVLGSYSFTGKTNEVGTVTKNLSVGTYYAVIYNQGITSNTSVAIQVASAALTNIADTSRLSVKYDYGVNDTTPKSYTFYYDDKALVKNVDYKETKTELLRNQVVNGVTTDIYAVTIEGIGNYSGVITYKLPKNTNVTVDPIEYKDFTQAKLDGPTWIGEKPTYTVYYDGKALVEGTDYTVESSTNDTVKNGITYREYKFVFIGKGLYQGSKSTSFVKIISQDSNLIKIARCSVVPTFSNGEFVKVTVKDGNTLLVEGTDYKKTVSLKNKTTSGNDIIYTYEITITGIGKYTGTTVATGTTTKSNKVVLDLSQYTVSDKEYTGKQIRPGDSSSFVVKGTNAAGQPVILVKDKDYTISYGDNVAVGYLSGTMTVTGIGDYTGSTLIRFNIVRAKLNNNNVNINIGNVNYTGSPVKPINKITLSDGRVLSNGTDFSVAYSNNTNVGQAKAVITFVGNYEGTVTTTFNIVSNGNTNSITKSDLKSVTSGAAYTGKAVEPINTIQLKNGKTLKNGTDFTVSYSNNVNVGVATAKITFKGSYSGQINYAFSIFPSKQFIQNIYGVKNGFFVDYLNKSKSVGGYEVRYSTSSNFANASHTYVKYKTRDTATITGLKSNTTYYVKVRSYKTVSYNGGKKTIWGYWSPVKTVKTL